MSKTGFKRFLRKTRVFFKTNALALIICVTTMLSLAIIGFAAYFSLNSSQDTSIPSGGKPSIDTPVSNGDPIVFLAPLDTINITHDYADDHLLEDKTTGFWQTHQGIDFAAAEGAAVKAVYSGTIESVKNSTMDGTVVTLKISDTLKVVYKSLATEVLVSQGDKVDAGKQIGTVGTSVTEKGEGVHLHIEVWQKDKLVDPNLFFSFSDK